MRWPASPGPVSGQGTADRARGSASLSLRRSGAQPASVAGPAQDSAIGHELAAGRARRLVGGEEPHHPEDLDRLREPPHPPPPHHPHPPAPPTPRPPSPLPPRP